GLREWERTAHTRELVRQALQEGRAVRMRYYTASKDEMTDRTVDPMRLLIVQAVPYLEGWCRRAEAVRLFRLDRIDHIEVTDEQAAPPPHARHTDLSEGVFSPREDHPEEIGRAHV